MIPLSNRPKFKLEDVMNIAIPEPQNTGIAVKLNSPVRNEFTTPDVTIRVGMPLRDKQSGKILK